jgi:excisionase family DNA binding protein
MATSYPKSFDNSIRTNPPALLSISELAFVLGLSNRALHNYVARGLIPRVKLGRRVLFRWTQVQASLAKIEKAGG